MSLLEGPPTTPGCRTSSDLASPVARVECIWGRIGRQSEFGSDTEVGRDTPEVSSSSAHKEDGLQ